MGKGVGWWVVKGYWRSVGVFLYSNSWFSFIGECWLYFGFEWRIDVEGFRMFSWEFLFYFEDNGNYREY